MNAAKKLKAELITNSHNIDDDLIEFLKKSGRIDYEFLMQVIEKYTGTKDSSLVDRLLEFKNLNHSYIRFKIKIPVFLKALVLKSLIVFPLKEFRFIKSNVFSPNGGKIRLTYIYN